jgi:RNA polymerase sigma-70 factor (ECF subfamily)
VPLSDSELQRLFQQYGYLVHRRCQALLQDRVQADDALQDTFVRVSRYGHTQQGGGTLAWLYSIAFNVCCDHLKRRHREEPSSPDRLSVLQRGALGSTDEADKRAVVGAALRQVGRRTREMVVLHHLDGLTQDEVAAASGYSRKTVGKKLRAFAELLKRRWSPQGEGS